MSRLAITSLVLAASFLLQIATAIAGYCPFQILVLPALICFLLAPIFGIAALVAIVRSSGRLVGNGIVFGTFLIVIVGVFIPTPPSQRPYPRIHLKAAAATQALCTSSKCYHNEYGHWPQPNNIGDLVLIFNGLRDPRTGKDASGERSDLINKNPRRIQFMEFKLKDVTPFYSHANSTNALAFYDPWGMPYAFCFDNGKGGVYYAGPFQNGAPSNLQAWNDARANDNQIPLPFSDGTSTNNIAGGCAFFSNGPDTRSGNGLSDPGGKYQKKAYEDDIRSWK